jgi:RNA polymerase sigma factor (sigma-70 family)
VHDLPTRLFLRFRDRGDELAFSELFDLIGPSLLRTAQRLTSIPGAGEDLVQATFIVALNKAGEFRRGTSVRPWLFGILAREALAQRRDAEERVDYGRVLRDGERSEPPQPESEASARETRRLVMEAVRQLPDPYRGVLLLHLSEELGGKEIAARTSAKTHGLTAAHARVLIQRGLARLRGLLGDGASYLVPTSLAIALGSSRSDASPLSSVKHRVMDSAATSSSSATTSIPLAGLLMNKVTLLIAAAAVVAATALRQLSPPEPTPSEGVSAPMEAAPPMAAMAAMAELGSPVAPRAELSRATEELVSADTAVGPDLENSPAQSDDPASTAARTGTTLVSLLARSLDSSPPTLGDVEELVFALADECVIVEDSAEYYQDGGLRSAMMQLPGTDLTGEVSVDGPWTRVTFSAPSQGGETFFAGHFSVVMKRGPSSPAFTSAGGVTGGSAVFQHHPNTSEAPPAGMPPLTCGWTFDVSGERTSIKRTVASSAGDGRSWIIGGKRGEPIVLEGAAHLAPYDAWAAKLAPILSE